MITDIGNAPTTSVSRILAMEELKAILSEVERDLSQIVKVEMNESPPAHRPPEYLAELIVKKDDGSLFSIWFSNDHTKINCFYAATNDVIICRHKYLYACPTFFADMRDIVKHLVKKIKLNSRKW
jgi:hypothetical protein